MANKKYLVIAEFTDKQEAVNFAWKCWYDYLEGTKQATLTVQTETGRKVDWSRIYNKENKND